MGCVHLIKSHVEKLIYAFKKFFFKNEMNLLFELIVCRTF